MSQDIRNTAEFTWSFKTAADFLGMAESTFRSYHAKYFSKVNRALGRGKSNKRFLHPDDVFKYKQQRDQGKFTQNSKAESAKLAQVS